MLLRIHREYRCRFIRETEFSVINGSCHSELRRLNSIKLDNFRIRAHSEESKMTYNGPLRPNRKLISIVSIDLKQELFLLPTPSPLLLPCYLNEELKIMDHYIILRSYLLCPLCNSLYVYKEEEKWKKNLLLFEVKNEVSTATVNKNNIKRFIYTYIYTYIHIYIYTSCRCIYIYISSLQDLEKRSLLDDRIIIIIIMIVVISLRYI